MRRTARDAIHSATAVRSINPRIAPGREAGAAGAASRRISVGASGDAETFRRLRSRPRWASSA